MSNLLQLRLQAAGGDPQAQVALARVLLMGREAPYAPEEAIALVQAACAKRDAQALMLHAALAVRGLARQQDLDEAIELLSQAAKAGSGKAKAQLMALGGKQAFVASDWQALPAPTPHHAAPRVFTFENFLPKPVCAHLISQTRARLEAARVKDPTRGVSALNEVRSNTGAGFSMLEPDVVLHLVRMRIGKATGLPVAYQEPANILHYDPGEQYRPHYDFIVAEDETRFGRELAVMGQRAATFLIYLNDGYEGGETAFPRLDWSYKGRTGDALLFWNLSESGEGERNSYHAGTPVTQGEKWLFSQWIRQKPVPLV